MKYKMKVLVFTLFCFTYTFAQCGKYKLLRINERIEGYYTLVFEKDQYFDIVVLSEICDTLQMKNYEKLELNKTYSLKIEKFLPNLLFLKICYLQNGAMILDGCRSEIVELANTVVLVTTRRGDCSYRVFGNIFKADNIKGSYILKE